MNLVSIYAIKLRNSGLRPTKQRIKICEVLFDTEKTFHFSINDLSNIINNKSSQKISLATIYNTVHAFKEKGYLKQIPLNANQAYFDTNISDHHHFYDAERDLLYDIPAGQVQLADLPAVPEGHDIEAVNVVIHISSRTD